MAFHDRPGRRVLSSNALLSHAGLAAANDIIQRAGGRRIVGETPPSPKWVAELKELAAAAREMLVKAAEAEKQVEETIPAEVKARERYKARMVKEWHDHYELISAVKI